MQLETFTKALANQTRLRILMLLKAGGELCVCELTQALGLAQPKISRHLAILRKNGLLLDRKVGLWVYYRLNPELPVWCGDVLAGLQMGSLAGSSLYREDATRLQEAERQNNPSCD